MCKYKILICVIVGILMAQIVEAQIGIRVREMAKQVAIPIERRGNEIIELIRPKPDATPLPGEINWTTHTIKAKGWGVIDTTNPNRAQARLMARGAAIAVAQRNLLEIVKGVRISSEIKVQDYMVRSDYIYKRIEGVISGAQMIGEPIEKDGIVEVEMAVEVHGPNGFIPSIWDSIKPSFIPKFPSMTKEDMQKIKEISAIAIDLSEAQGQLLPSVFPKLVDKNGNVIFDLAWFYDPNDPDLQKLDKIWAATKEELKALGIWDNPYVIKARGLMANGDIIIDDEAVQQINWLKKCFRSFVKIGKLLWEII